MKRLVKFALIVACAGIVIVMLLLALLRRPLIEMVLRDGIERARTEGIRVSYASFDPNGLGVEIKGLQLWFTKTLLTLFLDKVSVRPNMVRLLTFTPDGVVSGDLYGGSFQVDAAMDGATVRGTARATDISLSLHPQLASFGLRSGVLNGHVQRFEFRPPNVAAWKLGVALASVDLQPPPFGPFKIPPIQKGTLSFDAESDGSRTVLSRFLSTSNLGEIRGDGRLDHPSMGQLTGAEVRLNVSLSETGLSVVGPYLPLMSNDVLSETTARFEVRVKGVPCGGTGQTRFRVKLGVGSLCGETRFLPEG